MEKSTPLFNAQKVALNNLIAAVGPEYVVFLAAQGPGVRNARVETFMQYQSSLLGQVQNQVSSAMLTRFVVVPEEEAKHRPVRVDVEHYSGKKGRNLTLWIREIEMTMRFRLISLEH